MACNICPFECGVDRAAATGVCRASDRIDVSNIQLHHWEEPPVSGTRGSGTVFFSHCNLRCRFCQNHEISQLGRGREIAPDELIAAMLRLRDEGAHNINLVSPTHYTEQIIPVLERARPALGIPVVWNSNGYEKAATIARLEGLVDVWLPDLKYFSDDLAARFSSAPRYFEFAGPAVREMLRQAGHNRYDDADVIRSGLIVRHLVLPGHGDDSRRILDWVARELGTEVTISLMAQYYPTFRASELPDMDRRLTRAEYDDVRRHLLELGFDEGFTQELSSASGDYTPDFH